MGCSHSAFDEQAFLQPLEAEAATMLPSNSLSVMTITFPRFLTRGAYKGLLDHAKKGFSGMGGDEEAVSATAEMAALPSHVQVENPVGGAMLASAPPDASVHSPWPVFISGSKSLESVRLELRDAAGAPLGLVLMQKAGRDKEVQECVLLVCSTTPRVSGQSPACEWKCRQEGFRPAKNPAARLNAATNYAYECLFTKTPLVFSSGEALYPWALLEPTGSLYNGHRVYLADKLGGFAVGKGKESYAGAASTIGGGDLRLKRGGLGCAVIGNNAELTTLRVAPGADPLLMLGVALLYEKTSLHEHFVVSGSGGGGN